jgi:hypothetical protein
VVNIPILNFLLSFCRVPALPQFFVFIRKDFANGEIREAEGNRKQAPKLYRHDESGAITTLSASFPRP